MNVTTILGADLQNDHDWELQVQRAIHLPKGEMRGTPHGLFVDDLTQNSQTDRLGFLPRSRCYDPELITQKTKWVYVCGDGWSIEVTREEIWDVSRLTITPSRHKLPIDLSTYELHRVSFKLAVFRERWATLFAENLQLQLGEAPS